ncbi:hypothetical protein [Legionella maioricensis]|uniref:Uncharacterized protein n=1 Tax=Legionella maioricensis TaxID=2896528 RepID=A0A9X2D0K4_9GAMM|nr:hypothetical protein [Legionella maioricensis]MCL9683988.1 hypothetical protein [Legionella maioricensis]MCL9687967.1 hypothetical protein [Legionella maioricensis]
MPKQLTDRLKEALNVSPAFDNCFFHSYAAHLLANKLPLPKDLFTFKSILGAESPASKLQARFPNQEALFLFEEYAHRHHPEQAPLSPHFIVEKTLVLGFLMREWFATQLSQNVGIADNLQEDAIKYFKIYREYRWDEVDSSALLGGANGCLYAANQEFLEFFVCYDSSSDSSSNPRFAQYFREARDDTDKALAAYWQAEGYQNYFRLIANPRAKIAYNEVVPVIKMLGQSLTIYDSKEDGSDKDRATVYSYKGNEEIPEMEVKFNAEMGHYYLLKTDETESLLKEYELSFKQYTDDRAEVLNVAGNKENKDIAANTKPSLLLGATCPDGHLSKPAFTLLLDRVDHFQAFIQEHQRRQKQLEEQQHAQQLEEQRKLKEVQEKANHVINQYVEQIRAFPFQFDKSTTADLIEQQKQALFKQLGDIIRNKEDLTFALKTLNIGASPKIQEAISTKTQEINSAAQQQLTKVKLIEEQQLQKQLEEQQRIQKQLEEQQRIQKQLEEQRKLQEAQQKAEQVVNQYAEQIRAFPFQFDKLMTVELIEKQKNALLTQLGDIIRNKEDLTFALKTLNIGASPKIQEAISTKTQEINSAAQQQLTKVKLIEEQQLQKQLEEQQRIQKQLEEQRKLQEAQQKAEQVVNQYAEQIRAFPFQFDKSTTADLIEQQKQALIKQLEGIIRNKEDLTQALKTLNIGQSPKIQEAISTKTQAINSAAQQQLIKVKLIEEQQLQKQLEEQQRIQKQLEEQRKLQEAQQVVNQYAEQIRAFPFQFDKSTTADLIEQQKQALIKQLEDIIRNKEDLTQALKTLNIGQSPKIQEAISTKTQAINLAAQQQLSVVRRHEEEQQRIQKQVEEQELERRREEQHVERLLEEEQLPPSEEIRRQQFMTTELIRIDAALSTLREQISRVDQHHSPEAFNKADRLLLQLQRARNNYSTALNQQDVIISQASSTFKETCARLIDDAKPLLERDLGWGDYLTNLLKTIANAIIWVGSFGQRSSFFPLIRSESILAIENVEQRLELSQNPF